MILYIVLIKNLIPYRVNQNYIQKVAYSFYKKPGSRAAYVH